MHLPVSVRFLVPVRDSAKKLYNIESDHPARSHISIYHAPMTMTDGDSWPGQQLLHTFLYKM